MKNLIALGVGGALLFSQSAMANDTWEDINPYIGVEYKYQSMKGKGDWGGVVPSKHHNGGIFFGSQFHENGSIEIGYNQSFQKDAEYTFDVVGNLLGYENVTAGTTLKTKVKTKSTYLDLIGFAQLNDCFDMLASFGLGWTEAKFSDYGSFLSNEPVAVQIITASSSAKIVPRLGLGLVYKHDHWKIRGKLMWENTNKLRLKDMDGVVPRDYYKDSVSVALGVSYSIY